MAFYHIIILAIVQGITEFLPISSSGHLVLLHHFLDTGNNLDFNRIIDVSVHVGTLFAVLLYFRKDFSDMAFKREKSDRTLILNIIVGSVPVMLVGVVFEILDPTWLGSIELIAWCLILYGVLLWVADRFFPNTKTVDQMTWKNALVIGCAQALALIPGTSRAGITMTAARFMGFERTSCAKFSLMLATVAIAAAGALKTIDLIKNYTPELLTSALLGILFAFLAGYGVIAFMMGWLKRFNFTPFVIYRILLGGVLLWLTYSGVITA